MASGSLWREFVVSEVKVIGRMVRTPGCKFITYKGDPVGQLFDMLADPGETKNLVGETKYAPTVEAHRKLLKQREAHLKLAPALASQNGPADAESACDTQHLILAFRTASGTV